MKVCPKCGYIDDRMWRAVPWRRQVDYARMDLFEEKYPEFAVALKNGKPFVIDKPFVYRSPGKKLFVERVDIYVFEAYGKKAFQGGYEAVNHKQDPYQQKLI